MNGSPTERKECSSVFIVYSAAILGAFLIVAGLVWAMVHYTAPAPLGTDRAVERKKFLAEIRAADAEALNNYGWLDKNKGIVRLPIEQAMKLVESQWQNPPAARSNLISRVEKATAVPPPVSYE
ncbi:MAG TPA: hypothetical protein VH598_15210 [Verrucomicrobiae bacterium]|nr:hypothetical protein [Verrucomicrobiae bacterium]